MRLLHLDETLQRAEIIAEVQIAGRLHAGEHAFGDFFHVGPLSQPASRRKVQGVGEASGGASAARRGRSATSQPPPSATISDTAAASRDALVASSDSSSASSVASAVTTVVKFCVPARYSLSAICTACRAMRTA